MALGIINGARNQPVTTREMQTPSRSAGDKRLTFDGSHVLE